MHATRLPARRRALLLVLAAVQLAALGSVWPGFQSPNELSRLYAAHAFVTRGEWRIDPELERYGFIDDVSVVDGRHYSNKAPGLIWAAVPVVAALAPAAPLAAQLLGVRLVLVSGAAVAAAWLLGLWVERRSPGALGAEGSAFVLLFASAFGVYAGTFFAHAWTGALLLVGAFLLLGPDDDAGRLGLAAGGFAVALAAVSEYPAALVGAVIVGAACWGRWRRLPWVAAGAILPLAGLAAYDHACFGSAWALSSRFEALPRYRRLARQTFFGFSLPTPAGLAGLLVSPLAGLFFFFPVLMPALAAPVAAWKGGERRLAAVLGAAVWLLPLVMSGYREWAGGASFGPRYLVLAVPFAVLALSVVSGRAARLWVAGAAVPSAVIGFLGRVTPPFAIDDVWTASTLRGWTLPAMRHGLWNRPFGSSSPALTATAVTVMGAVWLAALWVAFRPAPRPGPPARRPAVAALAVALLLAQLGLGRVTARQRAWLAYVAPAFAASVTPEPGRR